MELFSHTYEGKSYSFVITRKARSEIKHLADLRMESSNIKEGLRLNNEIEKVMKSIKLVEEKENGIEKEQELQLLAEELENLNIDIVPYLSKINSIEPTTDELMYIILKNSPCCKGELKQEFFDCVLQDMEDDLGPLEATKKLEEAKDKVFILMKEENEIQSEIQAKKVEAMNKTALKDHLNKN